MPLISEGDVAENWADCWDVGTDYYCGLLQRPTDSVKLTGYSIMTAEVDANMVTGLLCIGQTGGSCPRYIYVLRAERYNAVPPKSRYGHLKRK